jgi:uncharacterized membrane protein YphA (DoxX/SURF4 family)
MLGRQIAIGFGIALIFPLLVYYGVSTFYPAPKYQTVTETLTPQSTPEERRVYAEQQRQRRDEYNAAARNFARILVMVAAPLGIAAILIGAYYRVSAIGTGLIFGGIFSVVGGYWHYWSYLEDWIRFVSLLAGFAILLFIGLRRLAVDHKSADS